MPACRCCRNCVRRGGSCGCWTVPSNRWKRCRRFAGDSGPPWRFHLHVAADENRKHWRLEGQLISEGEEAAVPLKTPPLLFTGALVLIENRLADGKGGFPRLDRGTSSTSVDHRPLSRPLGTAQAALAIAFSAPDEPAGDLWRERSRQVLPQGRLIVQPPDSFDSNRLRGDVEFQYGGERSAAATAGRARSTSIAGESSSGIATKSGNCGTSLPLGVLAAATRTRMSTTCGSRSRVLRAWWKHWSGRAGRSRPKAAGSANRANRGSASTSGVDWFDLEGTWEFDGCRQAAECSPRFAAARRTFKSGDGSRGLLPQEWLRTPAALAEHGRGGGRLRSFSPFASLVLDVLLAVQKEVSVDRAVRPRPQQTSILQGISPTRRTRPG